MPIYSAITTLPGQAPGDGLGEALEALEPAPYAVGVFEVEDGSGLFEVAAHYEEEPDAVELALLAASFGAKPFVISEVPDQDWVAHVKRELAPVEAGRFYVYGSHDAETVPDGRIALLIDAAMAFGTGHHGTTLGCLRALDRMAEAGETPQKIADIGAGTAVLAMAAAAVWPDIPPVMASDIDQTAVETSEANVMANGLAGRVTCVMAAGFDHPELEAGGPYDLVFANILKGPLVKLAPDMARHACPKGKVILSGILNNQAHEVIAVYSRAGFNLLHRDEIVDWTTLVLERNA